MRRKFMPAIYFLMLLAVPVLLAACGSPQPTATPFDVEQLRSLVQDAVSQSMPEGSSAPPVTEEQLRAMAEAAIDDSITPGLTAEDSGFFPRKVRTSLPGTTTREPAAPGQPSW